MQISVNKQQQISDFDKFISPTFGQMDFKSVMDRLIGYFAVEPGMTYEIIIGTDSLPECKNKADFVSAIIVHRKSKGGIYFWSKRTTANIYTLRDRIYQEALLSIKLAETLIKELKIREISDYNLVIHVDIGPNGETKKMLQEIVGMVKGNGFNVKTKPESYGASCVADRHT
jgi:uncharacterized protein